MSEALKRQTRSILGAIVVVTAGLLTGAIIASPAPLDAVMCENDMCDFKCEWDEGETSCDADCEHQHLSGSDCDDGAGSDCDTTDC